MQYVADVTPFRTPVLTQRLEMVPGGTVLPAGVAKLPMTDEAQSEGCRPPMMDRLGHGRDRPMTLGMYVYI